eukprot:CAMPEP_0119378748 /NCGR_PEP_ID=MMETSP1334-20130426/49673_1 /TAXON_ID=127549 /ORGANISM="Calcidiscus leptoporus, Strain RCC1130" /LENGTH=84 /DNA_ID=CAMNT_0007398047 /DNA_START=185 /DNA_END=440 /DNA_ORIENTATION=-
MTSDGPGVAGTRPERDPDVVGTWSGSDKSVYLATASHTESTVRMIPSADVAFVYSDALVVSYQPPWGSLRILTRLVPANDHRGG